MTATFETRQQAVPRYINCKKGFVRLQGEYFNVGGFVSFTRNLRTATPFYDNDADICAIARNVLLITPDCGEYFAIVEPSNLNFGGK